MLHLAGEYLDQPVDGYELPTGLVDRVTPAAAEVFKIVPDTAGIATHNDVAAVFTGNAWKILNRCAIPAKKFRQAHFIAPK